MSVAVTKLAEEEEEEEEMTIMSIVEEGETMMLP